MDKDKVYLEEIKEFARLVGKFMGKVSYGAFKEDVKLQLAVLKLIENIGEASKRLSEKGKQSYPAVDWYKAAAMRNRLVHEYMDVDLEIVYDVATNEIQRLLRDLEKGNNTA